MFLLKKKNIDFYTAIAIIYNNMLCKNIVNTKDRISYMVSCPIKLYQTVWLLMHQNQDFCTRMNEYKNPYF